MASVVYLGAIPGSFNALNTCINAGSPPTEDSDGYDIIQPFTGIDLTTVMAFFWRVKKWSASVELEADVQWEEVDAYGDVVNTGATAITRSKNVVLDAVDIFDEALESETDIMCRMLMYASGETNSLDWSSIFGTAYETGVNLNASVRSFQTVDGYDYMFAVSNYSGNTANSTLVTHLVPATIEMLGVTVNTSFFASVGGLGQNSIGEVQDPRFVTGVSNVTGSVEIRAEEYWPYDPGDGGGPIYDSVTGEQLRSFEPPASP